MRPSLPAPPPIRLLLRVLLLGATTRYGDLNFPVNLSTVLSGEGVRLSLLVGFNLAR